MTIPETIRPDYEAWHSFLEAEVQFSLADSEKHTKEHCSRVLLFALLIADKMDLPHEEREVLCAAAVFHDSRRQDDWLDVGHGQRAADYYREYCQTHPLIYEERMAFFCTTSSRTPMLWTASGLDRVDWMSAICVQPRGNPYTATRNY